jgi:hypothetical protein
MGIASGRLGHCTSWLELAATGVGGTAARVRRAAARLGWSTTGLGDAACLGVATTRLEPGVHAVAGRIRALPLDGGG